MHYSLSTHAGHCCGRCLIFKTLSVSWERICFRHTGVVSLVFRLPNSVTQGAVAVIPTHRFNWKQLKTSPRTSDFTLIFVSCKKKKISCAFSSKNETIAQPEPYSLCRVWCCTLFLHVQYSACTPPWGWLNMWLIQHHKTIELRRSHADLFKLQNQLCKTAEEVYNRYCQDGAAGEWICCRCPADAFLISVLHYKRPIWHSSFPFILLLWVSFYCI